MIPFRDEAPNIALLLAELSALQMPGTASFEVIMVDDASSDGYEVDEDFQRRIPCLKLVKLPEHCGQSVAMHAGIQQSQGQWIVTMDADLQNDSRDIPRLLRIAEEGDYDLVTGWRRKNSENLLRRLSSITANAVRRRILGDPSTDSGCTLKVMKSSFAKRLPRWDGMHRFIPSYAAIWKLKQTQVSINHRKRRHGKSKVRQLSRAVAALRGLFRVHEEKRRLARGAVATPWRQPRESMFSNGPAG